MSDVSSSAGMLLQKVSVPLDTSGRLSWIHTQKQVTEQELLNLLFLYAAQDRTTVATQKVKWRYTYYKLQVISCAFHSTLIEQGAVLVTAGLLLSAV